MLTLLVGVACCVGACPGTPSDLRPCSILLGPGAAQGHAHGAGLLAHGGHPGDRPAAGLLLCRLGGTSLMVRRSGAFAGRAFKATWRLWAEAAP